MSPEDFNGCDISDRFCQINKLLIERTYMKFDIQGLRYQAKHMKEIKTNGKTGKQSQIDDDVTRFVDGEEWQRGSRG